MEGDCKHREILLQEWGMQFGRPVETPLVKHAVDEGAAELSPAETTRYRRAAARISYMSQDRADLAFAASHLAGRMSCPKVGDDMAIKRVCRYLLHRPNCPLQVRVQEPVEKLSILSDSDWASDPQSRRSVSGGFVMKGCHALTWWSRKQARVALSSCEAELNALCKAVAEGLLISHVCLLFGECDGMVLLTDSSAAKGVVLRSGVGKLKHLSVKQLWLQEVIANGQASVQKVARERNPADSLTHEWVQKDSRFFDSVGFATFNSSETSYPRAEGGCLWEAL